MSNIGNNELIQNFLPKIFGSIVKKTRFLDASQCHNADLFLMCFISGLRKRLLKFIVVSASITGILQRKWNKRKK